MFGVVRTRDMLRQRLRHRRGRHFYSRLLRPGDLTFDVGANVGERTRIFLAVGARVLAIEPNPACAAALRRINADEGQLVVAEAAAGATPHVARLRIATASTISSMSDDWIALAKATRRYPGHSWGEMIDVPVVTLDGFIAELGVPAFCKIDVEGYEAEVLTGLSVPIPLLSFEYTPGHLESTDRCVAILSRLGHYEFNPSVGESLRFTWPDWRDEQQIRAWLSEQPQDTFGDVYARLTKRRCAAAADP